MRLEITIDTDVLAELAGGEMNIDDMWGDCHINIVSNQQENHDNVIQVLKDNIHLFVNIDIT